MNEIPHQRAVTVHVEGLPDVRGCSDICGTVNTGPELRAWADAVRDPTVAVSTWHWTPDVTPPPGVETGEVYSVTVAVSGWLPGPGRYETDCTIIHHVHYTKPDVLRALVALADPSERSGRRQPVDADAAWAALGVTEVAAP